MQRHPCNNYFNLIIRQENLGEEFGFLANHLKMKKEDCDPNQVYHSNSNSLSSSVLKYEKYLIPLILSSLHSKIIKCL